MNEDAIEILTEMLIKEKVNGKKEYYKLNKQDLIIFSIKLLKTIEKNS